MKYPVVCFCIRRRFFYLLLSSVFLTYLSEGCCAKPNKRYNAILIFLQTKKASTNRVSLSATPKIAYQLRKIIDPLSYALSVPVFCFAHSIQRILQPVKYNLSFCLCAFYRFLVAVMGTVKGSARMSRTEPDISSFSSLRRNTPTGNLPGSLGRRTQN